ncbi:hypothetical protein [Streptomyces bobili]|uniref:hypothetical protein n=1 Tax=Streptomyces bobili TaxID=67280 RepID=UPI00382FFE7C
MARLRQACGTALVLISHDLALITDRTDTVTVLGSTEAYGLPAAEVDVQVEVHEVALLPVPGEAARCH